MEELLPQIANAYLLLLYAAILLIVCFSFYAFIKGTLWLYEQRPDLSNELEDKPSRWDVLNDEPIIPAPEPHPEKAARIFQEDEPFLEKPNLTNPFGIENYHLREFLNMPVYDSPANIHVTIDEGCYTINIHDCDKTAVLHGFLGKESSVENALHKFDTLIDALKRGRRHIQYQYAMGTKVTNCGGGDTNSILP